MEPPGGASELREDGHRSKDSSGHQTSSAEAITVGRGRSGIGHRHDGPRIDGTSAVVGFQSNHRPELLARHASAHHGADPPPIRPLHAVVRNDSECAVTDQSLDESAAHVFVTDAVELADEHAAAWVHVEFPGGGTKRVASGGMKARIPCVS